MNAMDGEYLGNNKINLGYGNSLPTNCLWVAGVAGKNQKLGIDNFGKFQERKNLTSFFFSF